MADEDEERGVPDEIDINAYHPSVTERFYTPMYKTDMLKPCEDHRILVHSNRICIITLADTHPILSENKEVISINFQVDEKTNRLANKVSGKSKRGAQWLQEPSPLCHLKCSDDTNYIIRSCLTGNLIEVNERLVANPQLITQKPDSAGYIAVMMTPIGAHDKHIDRLMSKEQYEAALEKRRAAP